MASIPCFLPQRFLLPRHCHVFISYISCSCSVLAVIAINISLSSSTDYISRTKTSRYHFSLGLELPEADPQLCQLPEIQGSDRQMRTVYPGTANAVPTSSSLLPLSSSTVGVTETFVLRLCTVCQGELVLISHCLSITGYKPWEPNS